MRVGHGFDMHRLDVGCRLVLGGVYIPWSRGLTGHSDADVLIHAVCDALLGAAGLGDLGTLFPDTEASNKGRDSREFLRSVGERIINEGFRVHNIDCTLVAQEPKLYQYFDQMQSNIEADLLMPMGSVNVKAKTTEELGAVGRGEGISAFVVTLLE